MFDKLSKPKEWLRLGLTGLLVLIVYGLVNPLIPALVSFGFGFAGIDFSLGVVLAAIVSVFAAELVMDQLDM